MPTLEAQKLTNAKHKVQYPNFCDKYVTVAGFLSMSRRHVGDIPKMSSLKVKTDMSSPRPHFVSRARVRKISLHLGRFYCHGRFRGRLLLILPFLLPL